MKILDSLPYAATASTENVQGETVAVRPYQIVVWVSVGIRQIVEWDQRTPRFPAILDTGNNRNFSISRGHLARWAGLQVPALRQLRTMKERDRIVPLHAARLWLHPNVSGERLPSGARPFQLSVEEGIAVYPDDTGPRLPVLGLRVLTANKLLTILDSDRRLLHLRSPDVRTKILRFLS